MQISCLLWLCHCCDTPLQRRVSWNLEDDWRCENFLIVLNVMCEQKSRSNKLETGTWTGKDAANNEWLQVFCWLFFQTLLQNPVTNFPSSDLIIYSIVVETVFWLWECAIYCAGNLIHTGDRRKHFTADWIKKEKLVTCVKWGCARCNTLLLEQE
jgi:hypothetical protein